MSIGIRNKIPQHANQYISKYSIGGFWNYVSVNTRINLQGKVPNLSRNYNKNTTQ
jgi:hypothetical protein